LVGIYKITNKINGKVYIGESLDIERRWNEHKLDLENGTHHSFKLQNDYNEYSKNNFMFEILEEIDEDKNLKQVIQKCLLYIFESKYIKQYDSINSGYNIQDSLDLILKGEKPIFEGYKDNIVSIKILNNLIKSINENNGIYIPSSNALKVNNIIPEVKSQKVSKTKIERLNKIFENDKNINFIIEKCNRYVFKDKFLRLSDVLKDNNFNVGNTYKLLKDIGILNNKNSCTIKEKSMFENRNENSKYITYVSVNGFNFLLDRILKHAKENNVNIFTWKFLNEILSC